MRVIDINLGGNPAKEGARSGDFVLYRDPVAWLRCDERHTRVCQILDPGITRMRLKDLETGDVLEDVPHRFVRVIPTEYIMRDIDEAPLAGDPAEMTPAAVAWLQQNGGPHPQAV